MVNASRSGCGWFVPTVGRIRSERRDDECAVTVKKGVPYQPLISLRRQRSR
jgi:hypothetical protein